MPHLDVIEHYFTCPYCWQRVSIIVDPTVAEQSYVEDCEVCCRPIQIHLGVNDGQIESFTASSTDQ